MRAWRVVTGLALASIAAVPVCRLLGGPSARSLRAEITALEAERDQLRRRVDLRMAANPRLRPMPAAPLRVGIPTSLLRSFIERLASGVVDQVRLEIGGVSARKTGEVHKLVTVGHYQLEVTVDRLEAQLRAGRPELRFGGDQLAVTLPVTVAAGQGLARLHFVWDGRNLSGAVCGDLDVHETVSGRVTPETFLLRGGLQLRVAGERIVASPRVPPTRVRLHVEPSAESWRRVQRILDQKGGACGLVLDRIGVPALLRGLVAKGILVSLPTEKIPSITVPIRLESQVAVRGRPVRLGIRVDRLALSEHDLWLGAHVSLAVPAAVTPSAPPAGPEPFLGASAGASAGAGAGQLGLSARTTPPEP